MTRIFAVMDYQAILKQYWGYDSFRGIQEDIIRSIGEGRDTLGRAAESPSPSRCLPWHRKACVWSSPHSSP